jgi:pilus assembly protein CpaB
MKPKTMILMVVAVVCGLGASYMTSRLLAERDEKPAEAAAAPKVKLLVAKKSLAMHIALGKKPEDLFVTREFFKDDAPKEALVPDDMAKLKGKYLKRGLRQGEHLTADDLMENNPGLKNLPLGMRAVGIQVTVAQGASGWACVPGAHVDIIWTGREGNGSATKGKLFLEDVIILAADTTANPAENGGAMVASVVTVALTPEDSVRIAEAMDTGTLRLVLRNFEDKKDVKKAEVTHVLPPLPVEGDGSARRTAHARDILVAEKTDGGVIDPTTTKPKVLPKGYRELVQVVINGEKREYIRYWLDANNNVVPQPELVDADDPQAPAPGNNDGKKD